jgi:hypothetical protein
VLIDPVPVARRPKSAEALLLGVQAGTRTPLRLQLGSDVLEYVEVDSSSGFGLSSRRAWNSLCLFIGSTNTKLSTAAVIRNVIAALITPPTSKT